MTRFDDWTALLTTAATQINAGNAPSDAVGPLIAKADLEQADLADQVDANTLQQYRLDRLEAENARLTQKLAANNLTAD